jgi:hypothetical protein
MVTSFECSTARSNLKIVDIYGPHVPALLPKFVDDFKNGTEKD